MKQILYDTVSQTMVIGVPDNVLLCRVLNYHQSMGQEGGGHNWRKKCIHLFQVSEHIDNL